MSHCREANTNRLAPLETAMENMNPASSSVRLDTTPPPPISRAAPASKLTKPQAVAGHRHRVRDVRHPVGEIAQQPVQLATAGHVAGHQERSLSSTPAGETETKCRARLAD